MGNWYLSLCSEKSGETAPLVFHTYYPREVRQRLSQEDHELKASLGYTGRERDTKHNPVYYTVVCADGPRH